MTPDEAREVLAAIAAMPWKFAKTYAERAPHEYCLWFGNEAAFVVVADAIRQHGVRGDFHGHSYKYLLIDGHGWKYWRYRILINRARL